MTCFIPAILFCFIQIMVYYLIIDSLILFIRICFSQLFSIFIYELKSVLFFYNFRQMNDYIDKRRYIIIGLTVGC